MSAIPCPRCGSFSLEIGVAGVCPDCVEAGQRLRAEIITRVRRRSIAACSLAGGALLLTLMSVSVSWLSWSGVAAAAIVGLLVGAFAGWGLSRALIVQALLRARQRGLGVTLAPIDVTSEDRPRPSRFAGGMGPWVLGGAVVGFLLGACKEALLPGAPTPGVSAEAAIVAAGIIGSAIGSALGLLLGLRAD